MKRPAIGGILCLALVGCGPGGTTSTEAPPPAAQSGGTPPNPVQPLQPPALPSDLGIVPEANFIDGDPPHRQNVIWMTANDGHDAAVTAACIGTVTTYRLRQVKRKHKVRWNIQNDPFNPCPNLTIGDVQVRFNNAIMANGVDPMEPGLTVLTPPPNKAYAEGRVHASSTQAPDGVQKYLVFYKGLQASPDPEVDIDGQCGGCGPGGGS